LSPRSTVGALALSSDGRYLAALLGRRSVIISSVPDGEPVYNYVSRGGNSIFGLAWSTNNLLAVGGSDQTVDIIDVMNQEVVKSHTTQSTVHSLSWDPNGSGRLAIAQENTTISIWNTTNDAVISGTGHTGAVTAIAWSNQYLASASADKTIIIWNV
jgi:WD40 repeat protein